MNRDETGAKNAPTTARGGWLIYGANGYSGELIAREAVARGLKPVLAGRNSSAVATLAKELKLEFRVFDLEDPALASKLRHYSLVLHCAGPFVRTAEVMAKACIQAGCHYLDITGEIPVYELLQNLRYPAEARRIMLLPGVGFDIVPTDCLAKRLQEAMPDAISLRLGIWALGSVSRGTLKSALAQMPEGGKVRRNATITTIPMGSLRRTIAFGGVEKECVAIPWGDVFTAYYTTGIPDIEVYAALPGLAGQMMAFLAPLAGMLRLPMVLGLAQKIVETLVVGPATAAREAGMSHIWGRVENSAGKALEMNLTTAEGYKFTALSAVQAVQAVMAGKFQPGFQTPAGVFGSDFVTMVPGSTWRA